MEGTNEEEWMIEDQFHPSKGRLSSIWNSGLNLGKKIALTGIVASAAPLALPSLVVLSAFGVAFTVPFGFYLASYAVTDKLMSTLLSKPKPPPPPLSLGCEYVSDDDDEEVYEYNLEKVDEEENNAIQDEGLKDMGEVIVDKFDQDGYEEGVGEYMEKEELIPTVVTEILKGIREAEDEISSMKEGRGEMLGDEAEAVVVAAEIGGENDIDVEQVEEVDVFGPRVSIDSGPNARFADIESEDLGRETTGMKEPEKSFPVISHESIREIGDIKQACVLESLSDEGKEESANVQQSVEKTSLLPEISGGELSSTDDLEQAKLASEKETVEFMEIKEPDSEIASEILEEISEAEEEISAMMEGRGEMLGNDVEAIVVSDEVGGENDINVVRVEEVDFVGPQVSREDSESKLKFGDVEPGELERETTGMIESIRDEGVTETKDHAHSMEEMSPESIQDIGDIKQFHVPSEKEIDEEVDDELVRLQNDSRFVEGNIGESAETSPFLHVSKEEFSDTCNLEQLKLPSEEETVVANATLQEFSEPLSTSQDTSTDDKSVSILQDIQAAGNNDISVIPEELEPIRDSENVTDANRDIGLKGEGEVTAVEMSVRKLVVHIKKSGDNKATSVREETDMNTRGKTLIFMRADTTGIQPTDYHPPGINPNYGDSQDANLHDHELSSLAKASTSKPNEELNSEDRIWKQINAMRAIVGYEAPLHVSCVEELKALYVFTGVEPPASFSEPSSMEDVTEKLQFLMAIVGVKM